MEQITEGLIRNMILLWRRKSAAIFVYEDHETELGKKFAQ